MRKKRTARRYRLLGRDIRRLVGDIYRFMSHVDEEGVAEMAPGVGRKLTIGQQRRLLVRMKRSVWSPIDPRELKEAQKTALRGAEWREQQVSALLE